MSRSTLADRRLRLWLLSAFCFCLMAKGASVTGQELSTRIDALLRAGTSGPIAPACDDAEFMRRVSLDLIGRIPSTAEAEQFLADGASDKRAQFIAKLLTSPEHVVRMSDVFNVMLMERLGEHEEWYGFLSNSFAVNKPWDQMVREIVNPSVSDQTVRGAGFFLSKRLEKYGQNPVDYPGLVRDVGRMFLGVDVQCAECHDHLFINDYTQLDYQGLYGFLAQTKLRGDVEFPAVAEGIMAKPIAFKSVFLMEDQQTGPRLPGAAEHPVPSFAKGEEYLEPPDAKTRFPGVPKFSPLALLADDLPQHPNFSRNMANRLWWMMLGRGLIDPLDMHHSDNPASHPELLDELAGALVAQGYDLRWMLRELALSEAYQRSSQIPPDFDANLTEYRVALEKPLSAEQLFASILTATGTRLDNAATKVARKRFQDAYANPPREPEVTHSPSVKAALFLQNDSLIQDWLRPNENNLTGRLSDMDDSDELARELYLSVLTRYPTDEERQEVHAYLEEHGSQRQRAVGHLTWSLIASTEFSVNH